MNIYLSRMSLLSQIRSRSPPLEHFEKNGKIQNGVDLSSIGLKNPTRNFYNGNFRKAYISGDSRREEYYLAKAKRIV